MESNQEQKKISSGDRQGQSSSKKSRNRRRSKKHRQNSSPAAVSVKTGGEPQKPNAEKTSGVSQGEGKAKSAEKVHENTSHEKPLSHRNESAEQSSQAQAEQKAEEKQKKASDLKSEKEAAGVKKDSEPHADKPKNGDNDGKKEEKKLKESSAKEETGKAEKKGEAERRQAETPKESVKQEKNRETASESQEKKQAEAPAKREKRRKRHGITFYVVIFTLFVVIGSAATMASLFLSSNNAFFANIPEVELPVFTKMNVDEILENPDYANFRFRIEEIYSNDIKEGIVADQSPKPPKSVKENAVITLKVSKGPESITVPSVVGWNRDTAREKFKDLGLSVLIQSESDRNVAPNKVIRTNPEAGTVVQAGDVITLYVSRSISEATIVTVPNCVGSSQDSAKNQLSRLGLVGLTVIKDGSEPAGTVIAQSPSGGSKTGANDTVQLYVSNGKLTAGEAGVTGGVPAQEGQQLYPGGPMVGNADGQVVPGSVTGHIHTWQTISGTGGQVCTVCGQTR